MGIQKPSCPMLLKTPERDSLGLRQVVDPRSTVQVGVQAFRSALGAVLEHQMVATNK
jgi:hypothetical protein